MLETQEQPRKKHPGGRPKGRRNRKSIGAILSSIGEVLGDVGERPGLSKHDRSLITVAALSALNRPEQLRLTET